MSDKQLSVIDAGQEKELLQAFRSVPFGNSKFQIEAFILSHKSPQRVYRQLCLELSAKYEALKTYWYKQRRLKIELKKLESKREKESDPDEKELINIDIEEKMWSIVTHDKLVEDGIIEFNIYYDLFKKMPKITRDDFDKSEPQYWNERLTAQAELDLLQIKLGINAGNIEALQQVGLLPHKVAMDVIADNDEIVKRLPPPDKLPSPQSA